MKAVMGLDGGGTKTLLRLASLDKEVLLEETGGPSNLCSCGRGPAAENLRALVSRALARAPERLELQSVCVGAAGILTREDAAFVGEILRAATGCPRVTVMDDAVTALYASLEDAPGLSLTAGTGSICLGKDGRGNLARVGGWGHLFSDEGSAYSMAMQALRRSLWGVDGRGPETRLLDSLLAAWSCAGAEELTAAQRKQVVDYFALTKQEGTVRGMLRGVLASTAALAIIPMADWLEENAAARMNTPGQARGNWQWRADAKKLTPALAAEIRVLTERYFRAAK